MGKRLQHRAHQAGLGAWICMNQSTLPEKAGLHMGGDSSSIVTDALFLQGSTARSKVSTLYSWSF